MRFSTDQKAFADQNYWAPECIYYEGAFYLITTLGSSNRKKGIYVLRSEQPTGPFEVYSERITPEVGHVLMERYTLNREYHI